MTPRSDTIAAISTAAGEAGISVVRISGAHSLDIADRVVHGTRLPPSAMPGGTFAHGYVRRTAADTSADLDEVIVLVFRAPHSYTREDVVEIQGHGGRIPARRILRAVLEAGAVPAEPGEFTLRAYLNGRIDLLQAEAICDLIRAQSDRAATAAVEQLEGHLTSRMDALTAKMLEAVVNLEATLDFPEDDVQPELSTEARQRLTEAMDLCQALLSLWDEGHLLREGARIAISGRPNVGKSTLLNALTGTDRAIVTDIPGTTRDTIEESIVIDGIPIRIVDTAGLRETDSAIELEGIRRAAKTAASSDLMLYVIDSSQTVCDEDITYVIRKNIDQIILVLNKIDIGRPTLLHEAIRGCPVVHTCLLDGRGLDELKQVIATKLNIGKAGSSPHAVISERHRSALESAMASMREAIGMIEQERSDLIPIAASSLRHGMERVKEITGTACHEDILNSIFSRFCIGK